MTAHFRLSPNSEQTTQLVEWLAERIESDRAELEKVGTDHDKSNHLRGRLTAWRQLQALTVPPRPATIDGKPV